MRPSSRAHRLAPIVSRLNATLLALSLACPGLATSAPTAIPWDSGRQGGFVTALTGDRQGHIWAATEDNGVWEYSPSAPIGKQWTQFTAKSTNGGLGDDDIYSLTCDRLGRIWAGTSRSGVSVFNGKVWKTYDRLTGPLGCHVVALATSPLTGDVWGCTEAGLFSYSFSKNTWRYVTRADGLPSDQATCLAFTRTGTLIVGTNCDGVATASPTDGYRTWGTALGPDAMPITRRGRGLPSSLINCLLVSQSGTVYAGTTTGLAKSEDGGGTWKFVRGDDWKDKVLGLYRGPQPVAAATDRTGILEDWVTALAEDGAGRLYVGHRRTGLEVLDPETGARMNDAKSAYGGFVDALLPTSTGRVFIGTYGDGLRQTQGVTPGVADVAVKSPIALPLPAAPTTVASLASMLHQVQSEQDVLPIGGAAYLGEDWQTQGEWVGRYGHQFAMLCAAQSPFNQDLSCWNLAYHVHCRVGPHSEPGEGVRHYVTWADTDDPRALYDPLVGHARQAEWDDHGESGRYGFAHDGPDLWVDITVPAGTYRLSLYLVNKDGHDGDNRDRDYTVDVKPFPNIIKNVKDIPTLAHARVHNFWGGVYEQFAVQGPAKYYVKIGRNYSLNTLCSGVFIDKLAGPANSLDGKLSIWLGRTPYAPPPLQQAATPKETSGAVLQAAPALWAALDSTGSVAGLRLRQVDRLLAYRAAARAGAAPSLLANWRWGLCLWTEPDRADFAPAMAQTYQTVLSLYPQLRVTQR